MKRVLRCAMAAVLLTGCSATLRPPAPTTYPISTSAPLPLTVGVVYDDQYLPVLEKDFTAQKIESLDQFAQVLRESNAFKAVRSGKDAREGADVLFFPRLTKKIEQDPLYTPKGIAIVLTLGLLSPVLQVHWDATTKGQTAVRGLDGGTLKNYAVTQTATLQANVLGYSGWWDAADSASANAIAKLVKDIIDDRAFFASLPQRASVAAAPAPAPAPAAAALPGVDTPSRRLPERPNDFALVVGVEKYAEGLPDAQFAESDARAVRDHLLALGVPERNMKFLVGQRALHSALSAYLEEWLPRNVKEDSRVFVYFSGHGAPDTASGQAFLIPWDGNPSFLSKTAYPLQKLYAGLGALKARQVLVALDSCFSGAGGRSVLAEGARPLVAKVDVAPASGVRLTVFAAASGSEITGTLKESGHGLFTYYFLRGLGGEASDATGAVGVRALYDYLKPKVQDAASRQNRDQTPVLAGPADGEIVPPR